MKKNILFLLVLFIIAFGCSKDDSTTPVTEDVNAEMILAPLTNYNFSAEMIIPAPQLKSNPVTKTIKFHKSSGTFDFVSGPCNPYIQVVIAGGGNASHIGNFTVINTYCSDGTPIPVGPWYGFITAANGDEIHTQMMGFGFDPLIGGPFYKYTILGGTGRFDGATGDIRMWGTADLIALTWYLEGDGEITY